MRRDAALSAQPRYAILRLRAALRPSATTGVSVAMKYTTQKARGVDEISKLYTLPPWIGRPGSITVLPYSLPNVYKFPYFARPCPERPRHGFVDSRPVKNLQELLDVFVEARMADPKAEVITMPEYTGKVSAIATDAGVTWGLGNAGVTSGGDQWDIPCPNANLTKKIVGHMGKDISHLYMEIVEHNGTPIVVQLRDGPKLATASGNYIPTRDYRVTNVILGDPKSTDLLKWEKTIAEAPAGSVLVLPGAGLSSHYAVHGIVHGLAVITGKASELVDFLDPYKFAAKVKIGDVLQPASAQPPPLRVRDYKTMRLFMRKKLPFAQDEAVPFAISILHSMQGWGRDRHLLAMRIHGATTMFRLLTAACCGEARHKGRNGGQGQNGLDWSELGGMSAGCPPGSRSTVFKKALGHSLDKCVRLADGARATLSGYWGGVPAAENQTKFDPKTGEIVLEDPNAPYSGSCSFGGPKWRRSAEVALCLGKALQKFRKYPGDQSWKEVAKLYNLAVLCGHNGGRVLDKFTDWAYVDACAKTPQLGFITKMAFNTVLLVKKEQDTKARKKGKALPETPAPELVPENAIVGTRRALTVEQLAMELKGYHPDDIALAGEAS